jgi:hypothetical protein
MLYLGVFTGLRFLAADAAVPGTSRQVAPGGALAQPMRPTPAMREGHD